MTTIEERNAGGTAAPPAATRAQRNAQALADRDALVADGKADPKRWLALVVLATAQLMIVLDASIVNIALPSAQRDLGIGSLSDAQWVVTAYTLAFGGLLLLGGRIADFQGRKRTFLVGLGGFALASAIGGASVAPWMLFGARGLQGAFAALMAPAALSLITTTFTEPRERAKAFAVFGAVAGGGSAIGLIVGGLLTDYLSWRWCLYVNIPIAIAVAVAAVPIVRESRAEGDRHYDIPGAVLVTLGLVSLVYAFNQASRPGEGWTAPLTLTLFVAAVVLLVGFVVRERRATHPLLPLRVPLDRNRGGSYLAFLLVGAGLFAMFLFLTYYFQRNLGYSPIRSGVAFLPFSIGIIATAGLVSQLLPRFGPKPLMLTGLTMGSIGLGLLVHIDISTSYWTHVLPALMLLSIGMALVFVPTSSLALIGVAPHDAGVASALLNTSQQVGGSLGVALLSTLYSGAVGRWMTNNGGAPVQTPQGPQPQPEALISGYHIAFAVGSGLLVLALIVVFTLINAKKDELPAEGAVAAG